MAKIKICGISRECDAQYINEAMPDYTGFVFSKSKRRVTLDRALKLRAIVDKRVKTVGVFVNEDFEFIAQTVREGAVSVVQLHGDEDDAFAERIRSELGCDVIRAVRIASEADVMRAEKRTADYLLFDTFSKNAYGGTGEMFDHSLIKTERPFFVAGGINAENVIDVINKTKPFAVDVSSGVETDGFKDRDKILDIVRRVRNV